MRISAKGWRLAALGGNTVALEWGDQAAGQWVQRLIGSHPCAPNAVPEAVYRLHSHQNVPGFTVFAGTDCIYNGMEPEKGVHAVMEAMMQVWIRRCTDGLMLHAALLAKRGHGLLISGESGAGKSTLSAWLMLQGWTYHGDEQMYADANDMHWEGFVRPLCFKGEWAPLFPGMATQLASVEKVGGRSLVPAALLGQMVPPETAVRPGLMLFPTYREGSDFSLQRISAGQAAMQLVHSTLNGGNLKNRGVAQIAEIVRVCPGYELNYGHFDQLAPLMELLSFTVHKSSQSVQA